MRRPEPTSCACCRIRGERYLSTPLFADIGEDMNEEEVALSKSTEGFRFDQPGAAAAPTDDAKVELDEETERFVDEITRNEPIVMFALEWCEFCWSARNLFAAMNVHYESVDLDSVAYQEGDRGNKIRAVLAEWTGSPTIPQIYVAGKHIGGCTELFDYVREGGLSAALGEMGVEHTPFEDDPYGLLPQWLHSRTG